MFAHSLLNVITYKYFNPKILGNINNNLRSSISAPCATKRCNEEAINTITYLLKC